MVQQSSSSPPSPTDRDHLSPEQPARHAAQAGYAHVQTHSIGQVTVLEVADPLTDVVEDLDHAIQLALADGPRGVVCDLSAAFGEAEPGAVEWLAMAGRHVRDWSGIPVAVACPNARVRETVSSHPLGRHLILTASVPPAVSAVLATPLPIIAWQQLAPHPTAPRASRDFLTLTLLGWGLAWLAPSACLVVSELVTNSTVYAGSDVVISVAWSLGALRLTVRDKSPDLSRPRKARLGLHGRGLTIVAGFSREFGVLPTAEGGKVVWAVLDAPAALPPPVDEVEASARQLALRRQMTTQEHPDLSTTKENHDQPCC